jgi:competence protein ComER
MEQLARAAVEVAGIPRQLADSLVIQMLEGTTKLLTQEGLTLKEIQERVSVPGGITEQGLNLLAEQMDGLFHQLFQITHAKFEEDVKNVQAILRNR